MLAGFRLGDVLWLLIITVSLGLWGQLAWTWKSRGWPLSFRLRRPVPWSPSEAVFISVSVLFIVALGLQQIFHELQQSGGPLQDTGYTLEKLRIQCLAQVAELSLIPFLLALWHVCTWGDFGIWFRDVWTDVKSGIWGVLLCQLPVALAEWPVRTLRDQSPHPLVELLKGSLEAGQISTFLWIALQVVILAPLMEELVFRVVLQGSLSKVAPSGVAILLSAAAFAGIHQAVDWAPLFPLALILGYVYHRRHSYFSVVVLHGLFNTLTLVFAWFQFTHPVPTT